MTGIPPQAITAAAAWLHDEDCDDGDTKTCGRWQAALGKRGVPPAPHLRHIEFYRDRAAGALAAAEPHLAAAERERCAQLAERVGAIYPLPPPVPELTVDGEPVPVTAGNAVIWPDGMPAIGLVASLLRQEGGIS